MSSSRSDVVTPFVRSFDRPQPIDKIDEFNSNVQRMLGIRNPILKQKARGKKPFHCPQCKVKSPTVADLKMHMKSSHSRLVNRSQLHKERTEIMNEDSSLLDETDNDIIDLDELSVENPPIACDW